MIKTICDQGESGTLLLGNVVEPGGSEGSHTPQVLDIQGFQACNSRRVTAGQDQTLDEVSIRTTASGNQEKVYLP